MTRYLTLSLGLFCSTACTGPYFYKYSDPPSSDGRSEVVVSMEVKAFVPQAAYFLEGESCSDLRDLQLSNDRSSRTVLAPIGRLASFHIHGLVSLAFINSLATYPYTKLRITTCGNQIVSFPVGKDIKYRLSYVELANGCSLSLYGEEAGKVSDISESLIPRTSSFGSGREPSSSFCTDHFDGKTANPS